MYRWLLTPLLALVAASALAAPKDCDELRSEIEVKIQAAGVQTYTLEIVDSDEVQDQNLVVGSCAGGSKKIIYQKHG